MTKIGTSNFVNKKSALNYYKNNIDQDYTIHDIHRMVKEESISIGKPEIKRDEFLTVENGRYIINVNK